MFTTLHKCTCGNAVYQVIKDADGTLLLMCHKCGKREEIKFEKE